MDIYIVLDGQRVVGASTRLQGAEVIRANEAKRLGAWWLDHGTDAERQAREMEQQAYDRMRVVNTELQDTDDQ